MAKLADKTLVNIRNVASGKYLNLYSSGTAGNGTNICTYAPDGTNEQKFWYQDKKFYCFTDNEFCLDRNTSTNNAQSWKATNGDNAAQLLTLEDKGSYMLIKLASTSLYLTQTGTTGDFPQVAWTSSSTSTYSRWTYTELSNQSNGISLGNNNTNVGTVVTKMTSQAYKNRFPTGQCTWYCQGRAFETYGKIPTFTLDSGLDAYVWYSSMNGTKSQTPRHNSIVCWSAGPTGLGHVAYVEIADGTSIYITEANYGGTNGAVQLLTSSQYKTRGTLKLSGFIYL